MIRLNEKLTVLVDVGEGNFLDITRESASFDRDQFSRIITSSEKIYVGFYKPINSFYMHFSTANTNTATLSVKYYNGSAFTDVSGLYDDTDGFTRSGFVSWDRKEQNKVNESDETETAVNSLTKYWYELALDAVSSEIVISGINIVFCDDQDLKRELYEIDKYYPLGETSHILTLEACRDEIIQELNLLGKTKDNTDTNWKEDITAFDLLDISQVKLASTYLALAKIMFNVSDQVDDSYLQKSQIYRSKYNNIINNMSIDIDHDDDGLKDRLERDNVIRGVIRRE